MLISLSALRNTPPPRILSLYNVSLLLPPATCRLPQHNLLPLQVIIALMKNRTPQAEAVVFAAVNAATRSVTFSLTCFCSICVDIT